MRILLTTSNQSIVGGVERYLQLVIPALLQRGHEIALLYEHRGPAGSPTVHPVDARLPVWYWEDLVSGPGTLAELSGWKPDLVYAHGLASLGVENVLLDRYPVVWYAHVYLGTCATGQKCHAFPQARPCTRTFGPMCLLMHYPRRCGGLNPVRAWQMFQVQARRNSRLGDYKSILVASRHMRDEYARHGVDSDKLQIVPLPIAHTAPEAALFMDRMLGGSILFVGRLTNLKGVDHLVRAIPIAAQKLNRVLTLTIAGDGPARSSIEQLARELNVPVRFLGWVESEHKENAMRQAHLLVVPSLWPEPFGMVGMEAGSLGLPAAGYAVGGIPDWLIGGQTGEIASGDPPTVAGLAEAIVRALADPGHYAKLCRGAWQLARRFTLDSHLVKLEEIFQAQATSAHHASTVCF
jgi:glycosyltransferase involved in cell wall biosynthesis